MELRHYLSIFLKRWWIILPLVFLSLTISFLFSYSQAPVYEATSTYITTLGTALSQDTSTVLYGMETLTARQQIFISACQVITSQAVRDDTFQMVGLDPRLKENDLYKITCTNLPETNILLVSVQGHSPTVVTRLSEALGIVGIAKSNELSPYFPAEALDPPFLNPVPVSPKYLQTGILGGALGLVLGLTLAVMIEYLRQPGEKFADMSIRHPQLGIYNERYFTQRFEQELGRPYANLRPISMAVLKLQPNEDFALLPEPVRNMLLRSATLSMGNNLRQGDIIAYLRPQTFGILLAETPSDEAIKLINKVQASIRNQTFEADGGYHASFGVNTGLIVSNGGLLDYETMLKRAHQALKTAEQQGENTVQVVRATPNPFLSSQEISQVRKETAPKGSSPFTDLGGTPEAGSNGVVFEEKLVTDVGTQTAARIAPTPAIVSAGNGSHVAPAKEIKPSAPQDDDGSQTSGKTTQSLLRRRKLKPK